MRIPHAILLGLMLIAAALFFGGRDAAIGQINVPVSETPNVTARGPYAIGGGDNSGNTIWRIDQATGLVSYCYRDTNSLDRSLIRSRPPYCSGWGF